MNNLRYKIKNKSESGQSLFEVVIALAVSALIVVALVSMVSSAIRNATFSRSQSQAATYAQEATEWLRGERDNDIATFTANVAIGTWCLKTLSWTDQSSCTDGDVIFGTIFTREVVLTTTTTCTVSITPCPAGSTRNLTEANVTVSWEDGQGFHEVSSVTNFSDWRQI